MLPRAAASSTWRARRANSGCPVVFVPSEGPTPLVLWGGDLLRFFEKCKKSLYNSWGESCPTLHKSRSFSCLQNRAEQKNTFPHPPNQTHKLMCSANLNSHQQILFSHSRQGVFGSDRAVAVLLIDTAEMEQHVLTASPLLSAI